MTDLQPLLYFNIILSIGLIVVALINLCFAYWVVKSIGMMMEIVKEETYEEMKKRLLSKFIS